MRNQTQRGSEHTYIMTEIQTQSPVPSRSNGSAPVLLTLGGLAGALSVASCCALPLGLYTLGLGTAWLGGIGVLAEPHMVPLIGASLACLAGGAFLMWRQQRAKSCAPGSICAKPVVRGLTIAGMFVALALLYFGYTLA
jgi:mercuric ion transport protein